MQLYPDILGGDAVKDSRQMLLDRDDALKSSFSGPTPPEVKTEDVGCIWFNTEEKQFYGLVQIDEDGSNPVWQRIANFSKFNTMDLGAPAEETLYVDLEGDECELKQDMIVLVEHTILPLENYEITEQGKRITFITPIPAGLKLELRWFSRTIVGRDGATFVPKVENRVLSFDNDQGLPNPEPIDFNEVEADVVAAGTEQRTLIEAKGTEQINLVESKGTEQVNLVEAKGAEQVDVVTSTGDAQVERVSGEGDIQVQNVVDTGNVQVSRVVTEGDSQVERVKNEGNTQTANATAQAEAAAASALAASESETACLDVLNRLGTVIKIKGRVDTLEDLPQEGNLNGDCYLVGSAEVEQLQEYYWLDSHWEFLGTANNSLDWGAILGDITKQADLQAELDKCVHKTGDEEISGLKKFTNGFDNNASFVEIKSPFIDRDVDPENTKYASWRILDKNDKQVANFYVSNTANGSITSHMIATGRTGKDGRISVSVDTSGNVTTYAPTPSAGDNSTQISTTAWFNTKIQVVNQLPDTPDSNVFYFITG